MVTSNKFSDDLGALRSNQKELYDVNFNGAIIKNRREMTLLMTPINQPISIIPSITHNYFAFVFGKYLE